MVVEAIVVPEETLPYPTALLLGYTVLRVIVFRTEPLPFAERVRVLRQ